MPQTATIYPSGRWNELVCCLVEVFSYSGLLHGIRHSHRLPLHRQTSQLIILYSECDMRRIVEMYHTNNPFLHFIPVIGLPQHRSHVIVKQELKEETRRRQRDFFNDTPYHSHGPLCDWQVMSYCCHACWGFVTLQWSALQADPVQQLLKRSLGDMFLLILSQSVITSALIGKTETSRSVCQISVHVYIDTIQLQITQWVKEQKCII